MIYPSVKNNLGLNLAVSAEKFDNAFEVIETSIFEVLAVAADGTYLAKEIRTAHDFTEDGKIMWEREPHRTFARNANGGWLETPLLPGWQVKPAGSDEELLQTEAR